MMMIGSRIRRLRTEHHMTQEQLAAKLFVTRNSISKWENGKGLPNIDSIKGLAALFTVSLDYLLSEEDLALIAITNTYKLDFNLNLIYSLLLFFGFALIGILIPYYAFTYDPTSGLAVFFILLPLSYVLLGIISVLISAKWPYVVISSALAITPIYVFFDTVFPSVIFGYWGIIYDLLFIGVYFLTSRIAHHSTTIIDASRLKKVFFFLSVMITMAYLTHTTIAAISLYQCVVCSAPWYTAVVINTLIYIVPIALTYSLFFYYRRQRKTNHEPSHPVGE